MKQALEVNPDLERAYLFIGADSPAAAAGLSGCGTSSADSPYEQFDPERGAVEIGGWHPKFFSQNGPPEVLETWAANQARFNLFMARSLPELEMDRPRVERLSQAGDSTAWEIRLTVRNRGRLPTALRQADLVKIVRPDRVEVVLDGVTAEEGDGGPEDRSDQDPAAAGGGAPGTATWKK